MSPPKGKKYIMFIDETGVSEEKTTPFTVTGAILEHKYLPILQNKIDDFKLKCFGKTNFVFHLKQILKAEGPFGKENGTTLAQLNDFWTKLPDFLKSLEFQVISITVDKQKLEEYFSTPKDPYAVAFAHIMKSFYSLLDQSKAASARIVLESRDDYQNLLIQKAFFDIFNSGTVHLDVERYKYKLKGFIFSEKNNPKYQAGLELADLICNPLSRARRGLIEVNPRFVSYGKENNIFKTIKNKIYVGDKNHDIRNWGFKRVPIVKKNRPWIDNPTNN